jgi:hypothetical protein
MRSPLLVATAFLLAACTCGRDEAPGRGPTRVDDRYTGPPDQPDGLLRLWVADDADDGTLTDNVFAPDGHEDVNRASSGTRVVVRFPRPDGTPEFARLDLPVVPLGQEGGTELAIRGVIDTTEDWTSAAETAAVVVWTIPADWPDPYRGRRAAEDQASADCAPLYRWTPDVAPLLREALSRGATHASFVIDLVHGSGIAIHDTERVTDQSCPGVLGPRLEVGSTARQMLVAKELLGRPTESSAVLTFLSLETTEIRVDYGPNGALTQSVESVAPAEQPIQLQLSGLPAHTSVSYRVRVRNGDAWEDGPVRTFHTARARGEPFVFTVTADGHHFNMVHRRAWASMHLLAHTMDQIASESPDFHLDLGDTFFGEAYSAYDAFDDEEMLRRYLAVRPSFERIGAPLFVALGNHEGEQGWRTAKRDSLPDRSAQLRKLLYPNPVSDTFYTANTRARPGVGLLENYYAFEWGDVLVVVLDPYRYTMRKPHTVGDGTASRDPWDWTLGQEQADWLAATLARSDARFKLVFAHQVVGGPSSYGRGGRMAAEDGPSEWGGATPDAAQEFATHRPGWDRPLHEVLADAGVIAFVHGHDHQFVFEPPLDGVAYVTVPQPGNANYKLVFNDVPVHPEATVLPNAGFVRFSVTDRGLGLDYVRSFLPDDGADGDIAFRTTWPGP